jgi:hypothetical protein
MGQIKTREIRELDSEDEDSISYCPSCLEYGIYRVLQEKPYL